MMMTAMITNGPPMNMPSVKNTGDDAYIVRVRRWCNKNIAVIMMLTRINILTMVKMYVTGSDRLAGATQGTPIGTDDEHVNDPYSGQL